MIDDGKYLLRLIVSNATFAEHSHYAYASYAMHTFSSLFIFIAKCLLKIFATSWKRQNVSFQTCFYIIYIYIYIYTQIYSTHIYKYIYIYIYIHIYNIIYIYIYIYISFKNLYLNMFIFFLFLFLLLLSSS